MYGAEVVPAIHNPDIAGLLSFEIIQPGFSILHRWRNPVSPNIAMIRCERAGNGGANRGSQFFLLTHRYPVDDTFPYHNYRGVETARPGNLGNHGGVSHPQPLYSLDTAVLINHRHWV